MSGAGSWAPNYSLLVTHRSLIAPRKGGAGAVPMYTRGMEKGITLRVLALVMTVGWVLSEPARGADMVEAGAPFPAWSLQDHTGKTLSSPDLRGQTYLLWFYPKAMTPGCTAEGRALRDNYEKFEERDVVILGVSFDEPASNARFVSEEQFPFRLLSDTDRSLATRVGAADSADQSAARRISYLVGPDGNVLRAYPAVDPGEHAEQVLSELGEDSSPPQTPKR